MPNYAGRVKFFRTEAYLDQLLAGTPYCNTPEYYRLNPEPGVSDHNESCISSYRPRRGDAPPTIQAGDKLVPPELIAGATIRRSGLNDRWLHCWTCITVPEPGEDPAMIGRDLLRLRREFGGHYAFVLPSQFDAFAHRVQELAADVAWGPVRYTANRDEWSPMCKSDALAYQHELRFLFDECPEGSTTPLILTHPRGFRDLMTKDLTFKYALGDVFFLMRGLEDTLLGPQPCVSRRRQIATPNQRFERTQEARRT